MMRQRPSFLVVVALALIGCAHAPAKNEVQWPEPPEIPRIRFVRSIRGASDLDDSALTRLRRSLLGATSEIAVAQPVGLAVTDDGLRLFITDVGHNAVLVADFEANTLKLFETDAQLGSPFGIDLDQEGNIYVADSKGQVVRVFDKGGTQIRVVGKGQFERPTGLALDRVRRRIYVADGSRQFSINHRVRVFDFDGKWLSDLGAQPGRPPRGQAEGQWHFPTHVTVDDDGKVFVADTMNFRIQVFKPDGKLDRVFGENGDGPGAFNRLKGLAIDRFHNLYAVDSGHANVQMFDRDFNALMFFGGYTNRVEYMDVPAGIAIHRRTNRIYLCNQFFARINVYDLINTEGPSAP